MRLREIREAMGMTQKQAAMGLNLSPSLYNRYENGSREPPQALLPLFADFFGVSIDELFGRNPAEEPQERGPKTIEARIVSAGMDRMSPADREFALEMFQRAFSKYMEDGDNADENGL